MGPMSEQQVEERWHVQSVRCDLEYGESYPAVWTVEMTGWQEAAPPCPGYVVRAGSLTQLKDRIAQLEVELEELHD
jgi:hypothetical protein